MPQDVSTVWTGVINPSSVIIAGSLNATGLTLNCPSVTVAGDFVTNVIEGIPGGSLTDPSYNTFTVDSLTTRALTVSSVAATATASNALALVGNGCAWFTATSQASGNAILTLDSHGNLTTSGTVLATSDVSVKANLAVLPDALAKVLALRGVTFDRLDEGAERGRRHLGLLAQEVEAVLPEAVYTDTTSGRKSVAYGNMVALLVQAIHELVDEVRSDSRRSGESRDAPPV